MVRRGDREEFVRADALRPGDHLKTLDGTAQVASVTPVPGPTTVYNLEIQGEHVYLVGENGVLVHNGTPCDLAGKTLYRGIPKTRVDDFRRAQLGIAKPRGTDISGWAVEQHVKNAPVSSGVTSWTTSRIVAERFAGPDGIILEVRGSAVAGNVVPRPPVRKYLDELEVLLKGVS